MLGGPAEAERLKTQIDITFSPANPTHIRDKEQEVKVDVDLKNVPTLIVKVYEINTTAYYLAKKSQIPKDMCLDGLVAKTETIHNYSEVPPIVKFRRTFTFPELNKRGVLIIEVIGCSCVYLFRLFYSNTTHPNIVHRQW